MLDDLMKKNLPLRNEASMFDPELTMIFKFMEQKKEEQENKRTGKRYELNQQS